MWRRKGVRNIILESGIRMGWYMGEFDRSPWYSWTKMPYEPHRIVYLICTSLKRQTLKISLVFIISYIKGTKSYEISISLIFSKKPLISVHFTSSKLLNHIVICCISEIIIYIYFSGQRYFRSLGVILSVISPDDWWTR